MELQAYKIAASVFRDTKDSQSNVRTVDEEAIKDLAAQAKNADVNGEAAIEVLLTIASGDGDAARSAVGQLMDIYGNPETLPSVRIAIGQQGLKLFEAAAVISTSRTKESQQLAKKDTLATATPVRVPTAILYLAGKHAGENQAPARAAEIRTELCLRTGLTEEGKGVLSYTRTIPIQEMTASVSGLKKVSVDDAFSFEDGNQRTTHLAKMAEYLDDAPNGGPHVAFVNVGANHWVTAVLCLGKDGKGGKVDCLVFDSNMQTSQDDDITDVVHEGVAEALAGRLGNFRCLRANLQEKTAGNACGVFAVDLAQRLDRALGNGSCNGQFAGIASFVKQYEDDWNAADADGQRARVTELRARMLHQLAQAEPKRTGNVEEQSGIETKSSRPIREDVIEVVSSLTEQNRQGTGQKSGSPLT